MRFFKNTAWPCITVIVACISWVLVNGDKVVDNVHAFQTWYGTSKALEGRWNNSTEYNIDPPEWLTNQKDFVEIRITLKDSVVDGTISSEKLRKIFPYDYVLLTGEKRGFRDTLDAYAFDYVLGKKTTSAPLYLVVKENVYTSKRMKLHRSIFQKSPFF